MSSEEAMRGVSDLMMGATQLAEQAERLGAKLSAQGDHDSAMRVLALREFAIEISRASTHLRQGGAHPKDQGRLL